MIIENAFEQLSYVDRMTVLYTLKTKSLANAPGTRAKRTCHLVLIHARGGLYLLDPTGK